MCLRPTGYKGSVARDDFASRLRVSISHPLRAPVRAPGLFLPLPNERVKHSRRFKPDPFIQRNSPVVRFGYGQRDETKSPLAEIFRRGGQHGLAEPGGAVFREHADLRDVADIGAHLRAEDESDQRAGAALEDDEGCLRIEGAAPGEAHDVVQKAQRAGKRPVLVVDLGINVSAVGGSNQRGGRFGREASGCFPMSKFMKTRGWRLKPCCKNGRETSPVWCASNCASTRWMPGDCCRVSMTWVSRRSSTSCRLEPRAPSRAESRTESRTKRSPMTPLFCS